MGRTLSILAPGATLAGPVLAVSPGATSMQTGLPDQHLTPGALNPAVTQANIRRTICRDGWTRTIRPPERYTEALKRRQVRQYGYHDRRLGHYEEDHLISLELGGAPSDPRNLWPEPHHAANGMGSERKDRLENRLKHMVCRGSITLRQAQHWIAREWVEVYRRMYRR